MSKSHSIVKGIVSNVGGYLISIIVAFLIAPITLHTLGDVRYGAWSLVSELIGYYGLLDLGIRGAVTYYVARFTARNQEEDIREILSSAFWLLSACGLLAFMLGIAFTLGFPYIFKSPGIDLVEVQISLLIMSALIAISLPMNTFGGSLVGKQRFDISTGTEVVNRVLTALMVYAMLKMGGGLIALAVVQAAGRLISWIMLLIANKKILGGVFVRPNWFRMQKVKDLASYGFRNAVGQVALLITYRMDLAVVGIFAGIDKVTLYTIAGTLVTYATALCSNICWVFTPRFTQLESSNDSARLNDLYFQGMRLTGMVVTGLVAGLLVFGKDFISLWLGAAYVTGNWADRSDTIMIVLILANLPGMLQNITRQRLIAMARLNFLMWINMIEAIASLLLSILLARIYGAVGVAFGTFIPLMVSQLIIMPVYSSRVINVSYLSHMRKGLFIPLGTGLVMGIINLVILRFIPPATWALLFFDVLLAGTAGFLLCIRLGLKDEERAALYTKLKIRTA